jgi:predicted Zn-dependent protease
MTSYAFDDEGDRAERQFLIRRGVLERGLGGWISRQRLGVPGVACARASGWNRAAVDRMANLNLEPGTAGIETLLRRVEDGVWMDVNASWSIDDARRDFQFGCEIGWRIVDGERKHLVRNPGYRGRTLEFWRSLAAVGNRATVATLGTPNCGKGEPNQMIEVGHASPACLFRRVQVFGSGR